MAHALQILTALLIGSLGALLFWHIGAPLPFMLGALAASALVALCGVPWSVPRGARDFVRPVIGVLAGSAFSPDFFSDAFSWSGAVLVVVLLGILSTFAGYLFFRTIFRYDRPTAFFASTPAGLTEMSLMGDALGGNIRSLFIIHSIRLVIVLYSVPFIVQFLTGADLSRMSVAVAAPEQAVPVSEYLVLTACGVAGFWIGRKLKIPNGVMLVSLALSAAVHVAGISAIAPPDWLVALVQIIIGCAVGASFFGLALAELHQSLLAAIVWACLLVAMTVVVAVVTGGILGIDLPTMLLSLSPGGMAEMTLLTFAIGAEVSLVVLCQISRSVTTLTLAPAVYMRFLEKS